MRARVVNVGGQGCQPVGGCAHLEVPFQDWVHLRVVDNRTSLRVVPKLLQGERRPEYVLRYRPAALRVVGSNPYRVVETEPSVAPAEQRANHRLVHPLLAEEHAEHATAEEVLQGNEVNLRKSKEPTGWVEGAIGDQGVRVPMEVHQVPVSLRGCGSQINAFTYFFVRGITLTEILQ